MTDILDRTFRANPDFELVLFDRLAEEQRLVLASLEKDPQFYGILRPRGGASLGVKSVCRDTALLFATLGEPGAIPRYVIREAGAQAGRTIAELVLDGVLAVQHHGAWLSGAPALSLFGAPLATPPAPHKRLARLSWDALHYAASLTITDAALLAGRLYNYNSLPVSPAALHALPTSAGLERAHPPSPAEWTALPATPQSEAWSAWRSRRPGSSARTGQSFKLYVSPLPAGLPAAFEATVTAARDWGALQFKLGRRGHDLLRPDKLVVYFETRPSLEGAATQIRHALSGCPAQGVPFTADAAGDDGLLSWGYDPPPDPSAPEWLRRESWRLKLSNRLAAALAHAKTNPGDGVSPVDFALERIRLEGIDTHTWSPLEETKQ